jgi:protein phosphatase
MTRDHSLAEEVPPDVPTEAVARLAHAITRAVGLKEYVRVDGQVVAMLPGDVLLLCSDGLHGVVPLGEVATDLGTAPPLAVPTLIAAALRCGGPDNVSCVVARQRARRTVR